MSIYRKLDTWLGIIFSALVLILAVFAPIISPYDPLEQEIGIKCEPPSEKHFFGTDQYGRDVLSRTIYGARYSLVISLSSIGIALILGTFIGSISSFLGGHN